MKMKIYIVQVLQDLSSSYDGLDDTEIRSYFTLDEARKTLKLAYDNSVLDFKGRCDIYDPEEDYFNEEEDTFRISDYGSYVSGRIIVNELEMSKAILMKDMELNDVTIPVADFIKCQDKIVEDYFECQSDSMWEELAAVQLVGFTIEETLMIASGCHEKVDSEVIIRVEGDTVEELEEKGSYVYEY